MKYIIIIIITLTISCTKEKVIPPIDKLSINELALKFDNNIQTKTKLRLAFGKAVANAMGNVDFRNYIKSRSKAGGHVYFDEIVFALHKDDVLCGSSLKEVIADAADDEIKDLFGDDFIDMVLLNDPLVSIKIPDIFFTLNWDTNDVSPMVYVKTPKHFIFDNIQMYKSYHSSGYQEMVNVNRKPDYFCVVVKYSEDYFLWDLENEVNENAISIFDLFPQFEECWIDIQQDIINSGILSEIIDFKYYFIKDLSQIHDDKCLSFNDYEYLIDDNSCQEECKRDCRPLNETLTFLESIALYQDHAYGEIGKGADLIYNDNICIKFLLKSLNVRTTVFFGDKYAEIFNPYINFNFEILKRKNKEQGVFYLPSINIPSFEDKFTSIQLKLLLNANIGFSDPNTQLKVEPFIVNYGDIIKNNTIAIGGSGSYPLTASHYVSIGNTRWYYCDSGSNFHGLGSYSLKIKY